MSIEYKSFMEKRKNGWHWSIELNGVQIASGLEATRRYGAKTIKETAKIEIKNLINFWRRNEV